MLVPCESLRGSRALSRADPEGESAAIIEEHHNHRGVGWTLPAASTLQAVELLRRRRRGSHAHPGTGFLRGALTRGSEARHGAAGRLGQDIALLAPDDVTPTPALIEWAHVAAAGTYGSVGIAEINQLGPKPRGFPRRFGATLRGQSSSRASLTRRAGHGGSSST